MKEEMFMGQYTEDLEDKSIEISPEDENYKEELEEVAKSFRPFDEALDDFIVSKGYTGAIDDIDAKISYINSKFELASVPLIEDQRVLKNWFTKHIRGEDRKNAFRFCFAFNLSVEESNDFFRRIWLQRGFDCHGIVDAIYYYAIRNHLSYSEADLLIKKAPKDEKEEIDLKNEDILYTDVIIEEISKFSNTDELLKFLNDNFSRFRYNNATAYKFINQKWHDISVRHGLADREKDLMCNECGGDKEECKNYNYYTGKQNKGKKRSNWDIYKQILEFCYDEKKYSERKLTRVLKNNPLIHPLAAASFPDRQGLEAILRGEHKSNELVRKTLILLLFYEFWAKQILDRIYKDKYECSNRCFDTINSYLADAGYPELYYGNPYDWIFLYALQDDCPLSVFRDYMRESLILK